MILRLFIPVLKILLIDRATRKFLIGVGIGLAFSMAVILCALGIMDGFDREMRHKLRSISGDIQIVSRKGQLSLLQIEKDFEQASEMFANVRRTTVYQTEAFIIRQQNSRGILLRSVTPEEYSNAMGIKIDLRIGQIALGKELAQYLGVGVGDEIVLALPQGHESNRMLPTLNAFKVHQLLDHGLFEFDSRVAYLTLNDLRTIIGANWGDVEDETMGNHIFLTLAEEQQSEVSSFIEKLKQKLPKHYQIRPFWSDFGILLEAVKIEKTVLALVLQVIVLVSLFNVFGFIVYIHEKKAQEIFLFRALGLSEKQLFILWPCFLMTLWFISCLISLVFVQIFDLLLHNLDLLKVPGEIYHLGRLDIKLGLFEYFLVFAPALAQIIILAFFGLRRFMNRPIIAGLRMEFN
ncbi:MAG: ABC transporter permease [Bdellovibrio sp.]|nr:ABC transporter permease [Bdellovibrio sp.]